MIDSNDQVYQCGYGVCLLKMQRYEEAISIFYKLINNHPKYFEPYLYLGKCLFLSNKINE